jgi:ferritin-like metal-binding protein YciE
MGLFTRDIATFEDLFKHGLQDIYYAEKRIVDTLPTLIEKASNRELKAGLKQHLTETEEQVQRLEQVFELLQEAPRSTTCKGIDGLLSEGDEVMSNVAEDKVLNAAIISAAQAVEHYEITRYGALIAWAEEMGRDDVARILKRTLREEKATDRKLTSLAEGKVNPRADGHPVRRRGNGRKASQVRT